MSWKLGISEGRCAEFPKQRFSMLSIIVTFSAVCCTGTYAFVEQQLPVPLKVVAKYDDILALLCFRKRTSKIDSNSVPHLVTAKYRIKSWASA